MSYKSPINIIQEKITTDFDNEVLKSVINVGIKVNKDELIKALEYDRNQYLQGYEQAKEIYEKALDKACEQLESLSYENNMMKASPYAYDCDYTNEEEWKEWCLKDD